MIPTFFGITLLTFALIRMIPGDPVEVMMGERRVDPEMHAQAMERLGLNKPLYAQYLDYIGKLPRRPGRILRTRTSVLERPSGLSSRRPWSCPWPPCCSPASWWPLAGVVGGHLKRGPLSTRSRAPGPSLAGYSIPVFWWGLSLIMFFSVSLGWYPGSGRLDRL